MLFGVSDKHGNNTEAYHKHNVCGCGHKVVCSYDNLYSKPTKIYRGHNAVFKLF